MTIKDAASSEITHAKQGNTEINNAKASLYTFVVLENLLALLFCT